MAVNLELLKAILDDDSDGYGDGYAFNLKDKNKPLIIKMRGDGNIIFDGNEVLIKSLASFPTFKINVELEQCGSYYYELQLKTPRLMQLGWSDDHFVIASNNDGVGDDSHSWGYDGKRLCAWNSGRTAYEGSKAWFAGDYVAFGLDYDKKTCEFFLNGESMGIAFTNMNIEGHIYPTLTLQGNNTVKILPLHRMKYYNKHKDKYKTAIDLSSNINSVIQPDIIQFGFDEKTPLMDEKKSDDTKDDLDIDDSFSGAVNYLCAIKTLSGDLELKTTNNSLHCKALSPCVFAGNFTLPTNANNKYIYEVILNAMHAEAEDMDNENGNGFGYANISNNKITESWTYRNGELYHNEHVVQIKTEPQEFQQREFKYESDFDVNGVIYALGSNFGSRDWRNPYELKLIEMTSSKLKSDSKAISNVIGRTATKCVCDEDERGWMQIDFKTLQIRPTAYTLRHYIAGDEALRNWNLEGSNNGSDWIVIKKHENDQALNKKTAANTWDIDENECKQLQAFQIFRVQITGPNSANNHCLACCGFEIYGYLSGSFKYERSFGIDESYKNEIENKEFKYESDFDTNGICYNLGTKFDGNNEWTNPAETGCIKLSASKWKNDSVPISNVVGRASVRCVNDAEKDGFIVIDFMSIKILPRAYTLRHYASWDTEALRNWNLEGSNNGGTTWHLIKKHEDDQALAQRGQSFTWKILERDCNEFYQMFKIQMTGANSNDAWYLACSGFEIYGFTKYEKGKYVETWNNGDRFTCKIDLKQRELTYGINGKQTVSPYKFLSDSSTKTAKLNYNIPVSPIFYLCTNSSITINLDSKNMRNVNEFDGYKALNIMDKFDEILHPKITVVDEIFPVKLTQGKGFIVQDKTGYIICSSRSNATCTFMSSFFLPSKTRFYYEIMAETSGRMVLGFCVAQQTERIIGCEIYECKENDCMGIVIDQLSNQVVIYTNGSIHKMHAFNSNITKTESKIFPAFALKRAMKVKLIWNKSQIKYCNEMIHGHAIDVVTNEYADCLNNIHYDIDKNELKPVREKIGDAVITINDQIINISARKDTLIVSNFKLRNIAKNTQTAKNFYYEVQLLHHNVKGIWIGFIDNVNHRSIHQYTNGHGAFLFDLQRKELCGNGERCVKYPVEEKENKEEENSDFIKWEQGSVVGVGINNNNISFFFNGKDLGVAWKGFMKHTKGALCPAIIVPKEKKLCIMFDRSRQQYPMSYHYPINVMQTYYGLMKAEAAWIKIRESEIYTEQRYALHMLVKHLDAKEDPDGIWYKLLVEMNETSQTYRSQWMKSNGQNNISLGLKCIYEDVQIGKDAVYPTFTLTREETHEVQIPLEIEADINSVNYVEEIALNVKLFGDDSRRTLRDLDNEIAAYYDAFPDLKYRFQFYHYCVENDISTLDAIKKTMTSESDGCILVEFDEKFPFEQEPLDEAAKKRAIYQYLQKVINVNTRYIKCVSGDGSIECNNNMYEITAKSHFPTFKINQSVPSQGKHFYQMVLGNGNLAQIGFGDDEFKCYKSRGKGVGDDSHSFAVDGYRLYKWCGKSTKYGEKWKRNDLLTCAIDMDAKTCSFYLNEKELGIAFTDMQISGDIYPYFTLGCYYQRTVQLLIHPKNTREGPWTKAGYEPLCLPLSAFDRMIGKLYVDIEYKKLPPAVGTCQNCSNGLQRYSYDEGNTLDKRCTKCFNEPKTSSPNNEAFASFRNKAKDIDKTEYANYYRYSCNVCNKYDLCSDCYIDDNITWLTIIHYLSSLKLFGRKKLGVKLMSILGKSDENSISKEDFEQFCYHLILPLRQEMKKRLGYIIDWYSIQEVLNMKLSSRLLPNDDKMDMNYFANKYNDFFRKLYQKTCDAQKQLKGYILDNNGHPMLLKTTSDYYKVAKCKVCKRIRKNRDGYGNFGAKTIQYWLSTNDAKFILCYPHGSNFGDGCGGAIQQTSQFIQTANELAMMFKEIIEKLRKYQQTDGESKEDDTISELKGVPYAIEQCNIEQLQEIVKHYAFKTMPKYNCSKDILCVTGTGLVDFIADQLIYKCTATSHFMTFKLNIKVPASGKYFYQMILGNGHLAQIGFADDEFQCSDRTGQGVGDDSHGFGVDGYRVLKWCNGSSKYGEKWKEDDLLTCAIDMDAKTCSFYLNDKDLGVAFENINTSGDIYPCYTLGRDYQSTVKLLLHSSVVRRGPWTKAGFVPLCLPNASFKREGKKQAVMKYFDENEINGLKFNEMKEAKFVKELSSFLKKQQTDKMVESAWNSDEKEEKEKEEEKQPEDEQSELKELYDLIQKYFNAMRQNAKKEINKVLNESISLSDNDKLTQSLCKLVKNLQKYDEFKDKSYWKIKEEKKQNEEEKKEQLKDPSLALEIMLKHHINGIKIFAKKEISQKVRLKKFMFNHLMNILDSYYWEFTLKSSTIPHEFFESDADKLSGADELKLDSKHCWEKFGDFLRNAPNDYKKLMAEAILKTDDFNRTLGTETLKRLIQGFSDIYFRYERWHWNTRRKKKNEAVIHQHIRGIVQFLYDDSKRNKDYNLTINSFIFDENWCNAFVSYANQLNKEQLKKEIVKQQTEIPDMATDATLIQIEMQTHRQLSTQTEDYKQEEEEKYANLDIDDEIDELERKRDADENNQDYNFQNVAPLKHYSIFSTQIQQSFVDNDNRNFYYFEMTNDFKQVNQIKFRISSWPGAEIWIKAAGNTRDCKTAKPLFLERTDNNWYTIKKEAIKKNWKKKQEKLTIVYGRNREKSIIDKVKESQEFIIGIAVQTKTSDKHFVVSSSHFELNILKTWEKQQNKLIDNGDFVLLIDGITASRADWFVQLKIYIENIFKEKKVYLNQLNYSLFPKCCKSVEVRTSYQVPAAILRESLSVDFSMSSILGKEFIVKKQTLYPNIKISQSVYEFITGTDKNKLIGKHPQFNQVRQFYNAPKLQQFQQFLVRNAPKQTDYDDRMFYDEIAYQEKVNKSTKKIYLKADLDEYIEEKYGKEPEEEEEEEKKHANEDTIDIEEIKNVNDGLLSFNAFTFYEIKQLNEGLRAFLIRQQSKYFNKKTFLRKLELIQEKLETFPIWPSITIEPKRPDVIITRICGDGNTELRSRFSIDTAAFTSRPLPLLTNSKFPSQGIYYYELRIKSISNDINTAISAGFSNEENQLKFCSTALPGKHKDTIGLDGAKGQLLISNTDRMSVLPTPFQKDQIIGCATFISWHKQQPRSFTIFKIMSSDSSQADLPTYPSDENASLFPIDQKHELYTFLSLGSKNTSIQVNTGPIFQEQWCDEFAFQTAFHCEKSDEKEGISMTDQDEINLIADRIVANSAEAKELQTLSEKLFKIRVDLTRMTEVVLRLQIASETLNNDKLVIDELAVESVFLSSQLYYVMFLDKLADFDENIMKRVSLLMQLNKCAAEKIQFSNDPLLQKLLDEKDKIKRPTNAELFRIISQYDFQLNHIDKSVQQSGVRQKVVINLNESDAPNSFLFLGKHGAQSQLLTLWKMISRDRLLNIDETSPQAKKQEFLLDVIAFYLSKPHIIQVIKELISKWSNGLELVERAAAAFMYEYEIKILLDGLIRGAQNPISTAVQSAIYLKKYSKKFPDIEKEIKLLSVHCEEAGITFLSQIQSNRLRIICLEADDTLEIALKERLETFICSSEVQFLKSLIWISRADTLLIDVEKTEKFRDQKGELTQWVYTFFGDYISMFKSWNNFSTFLFSTSRTRDWFFSPIGKMQLELIFLCCHTALIIYFASVEQTLYSSTNMAPLEILFHVWNATFIVSEIDQMKNNKKYYKDTLNILDMVLMLAFIALFVLRMLVVTDMLECTVDPQNYCIDTWQNSLYLFIWFIVIMFICIKLCFTLFVFKSMGLLVRSLLKMVFDIINFAVFLGLFVIAFATILLMATGDQTGWDSWSEALVSTVYGILSGMENDEFHNAYDNRWRNFFVNFVVLLYVVLAVIILLNFIIAVMSGSYEDINKTAERQVNFYKTQVLYSKYALPILPPPFQTIPFVLSLCFNYVIHPTYRALHGGQIINASKYIMQPFGVKHNKLYKQENKQLKTDSEYIYFVEIENCPRNHGLTRNSTKRDGADAICDKCKGNLRSESIKYECDDCKYSIHQSCYRKQDNWKQQSTKKMRYWRCNYCTLYNLENEKDNDLTRYNLENEKEPPDYGFMANDLAFVEQMNIDLCDNCYRAKNEAKNSANLWESIISFWIYHYVSFLLIRLPLIVIFFTILFAIYFPLCIIIGVPLLCCECCSCYGISRRFQAFLEKYMPFVVYLIQGLYKWIDQRDVGGYEIQLVNTKELYTAFIQEKYQDLGSGTNDYSDVRSESAEKKSVAVGEDGMSLKFDEKKEKLKILKEFIDALIFTNLVEVFHNMSLLNRTQDRIYRNSRKKEDKIDVLRAAFKSTFATLDGIKALYEQQIESNQFTPIVLVKDIGWQGAQQFIDCVHSFGVENAECVIEPSRYLLSFDDDKAAPELKLASQQTRKEYQFTNTTVLSAIQNKTTSVKQQ